jgi:hypothetical protein
MSMKKSILVGVGCVLVLVFAQACVWPFGSSLKVSSVTISYDSGPVSPEYYEEGTMSIVPDYELRTIAVNYVMDRPFKQNKTEEDSFNTEAVVGGEYFDRFEGIIEIIRDGGFGDPDLKCLGGHNIGILLKEIDGAEQQISVPNCSTEEEKVSVVETFYSDVVLLLTKNIF